jgi:hypothetical protein
VDERAKRYRRKAEDCLIQAAAADHPGLKQQLEDLARQWIELAKQIEAMKRV